MVPGILLISEGKSDPWSRTVHSPVPPPQEPQTGRLCRIDPFVTKTHIGPFLELADRVFRRLSIPTDDEHLSFIPEEKLIGSVVSQNKHGFDSIRVKVKVKTFDPIHNNQQGHVSRANRANCAEVY